jgi:hypothetical protein
VNRTIQVSGFKILDLVALVYGDSGIRVSPVKLFEQNRVIFYRGLDDNW